MSLNSIHRYNPSTSSVEDSTHIYKQIQVYNNNTAQLAPAIPCSFQQVQLSSVVDCASDYFASIVRWSAQSTLPVVIPDVLTSPSNIAYDGFTNYYVGIYNFAADPSTAGSGCYAVKVLYDPSFNLTNNYQRPTRIPRSQADAYSNPYFYISNIGEFLNYINTSIQVCATALGIKTSPRFAFNTGTGKIELLVPNSDFGIPSSGAKPKYAIIINQQLYNIMGSFNLTRIQPINVYNPSTPLTSSWYYFEANNDLGRNSFVSADQQANTQTIDILTQTNSSIPAMSPVDSIQMETATIPVVNTLTGSPSFLGPPQNNPEASQNNVAVLTSYQVGLNSGCEYSQGYIQYAPTSEYRLIDCLSNGNIQNLQISVKWLDKLGASHDMLLPNGQGASMLLLFRKKSFNK
jgi:hypothetical protein